jgi:hypothetical protein
MLREVFRTQKLEHKHGTGGVYHAAPVPYQNRLFFLNCMFLHATDPVPLDEDLWPPIGPAEKHPNPGPPSGHSIYLMAAVDSNFIFEWTNMYRWDAKTGKFFGYLPITGGGNLFTLSIESATTSATGKSYVLNGGVFEQGLIEIIPGVNKDTGANTLTYGDSIDIHKFQGIGGLDSLGAYAIHEDANVLLNAGGASFNFQVYDWTTGALIRSIPTPSPVAHLTIEDESRAYVILANRMIMLVDYQRGEVLGIHQIPSTQGGNGSWWNNSSIRVAWDNVYRRLLICEVVPDNEDGSSNIVVIGYRFVTYPNRITTPIPLRVPKRGRVIPVHCQVVGEFNEGVGGYIISSKVVGDGHLTSTPITDHIGNAISMVECGDPGSPTDLDFASPPIDDYTAPSPPDIPPAGFFTLQCSAVVEKDPPLDPSGDAIPTPTDSGDTPGGPDDGGGGGGGAAGSSSSNPIIVGPTSGAALDAAILASWKGMRHQATIPAGDLAYWHGQADHPSNGFSDRLWHFGWNAYWEARMAPGDTGSASPALASQPAKFQP